MPSMSNPDEDSRARRREQVRLAQRRRRARLAEGERTQVNLYFSNPALTRLDALALLWDVERQEVIERLLDAVRIETTLPDLESSSE